MINKVPSQNVSVRAAQLNSSDHTRYSTCTQVFRQSPTPSCWLPGSLGRSRYRSSLRRSHRVPLALGAVLGAALGMLQHRALREASVALIASKSAMDVRRALAATVSGRAYLYALWGSVFLVVAAAYALPPGGTHFGAIAGYCALATVRELITLRETFALQALAAEPQRDV